ncbi:MAG TPA: hypothetical protein VI298_13805 [Geobacteraceae bacterium]
MSFVPSRWFPTFCSFIKYAGFLLAASLVTGCGLLYTNMVEPYSAKFDRTPVGAKRCVITSHQIKEPVTGANVYVEWTASFILNEAHKAGIEKIHYMDKRTLSVLLGIYKRESLIIYGD